MTDEDRLIELLQRHQSGDTRVAGEILELVDTYFRRSLRPVVAKVFGTATIGREAVGTQDTETTGKKGFDGHCRYTEMVNDFFVKVLEKKPDAFWKAKTAADLRTWSSVVIANQMRDFLNRKKRGQQILAEISPLVAQRQTYFEERYSTTFEDFLELLANWQNGDDNEQLMARVLQHRYVDGMRWKEIAADTGLSDERVTKIRAEAERRLRKKL